MLYEIYDMTYIVCLIYVMIVTFGWVYPKCIVMYFGYAEYPFLSLLLSIVITMWFQSSGLVIGWAVSTVVSGPHVLRRLKPI